MDYVIADGRRQRKRQAVHQQLLETGAELFRERGIAGTTVDDIAEAADVARQTFFNHFPYKEALALELAADQIQDVAQHAHALLEAGTPALDVLRRTETAIIEEFARDRELSTIVARELLHHDPERAQRAARLVPFSAIFEAILIQAQEEGSIRSDLPLDVVARHFTAVLRCVLARGCSGEITELHGELDVWFDVVLNGLIQRSQ